MSEEQSKDTRNKYAVALGRRGGMAGTGAAKTRTKEHYDRIQALARIKKAETLIAAKLATQQAVESVGELEVK